jgi:hypothetical protein
MEDGDGGLHLGGHDSWLRDPLGVTIALALKPENWGAGGEMGVSIHRAAADGIQ